MKKSYVYPQTESVELGVAFGICAGSKPAIPSSSGDDVLDAPARKLYV